MHKMEQTIIDLHNNLIKFFGRNFISYYIDLHKEHYIKRKKLTDYSDMLFFQDYENQVLSI